MKIAIVTDAWEPQVNGVVRTLKMTAQELTHLGHTVKVISPSQFYSIPCPSYPEIRLALVWPSELSKIFHDFSPHCIHIATEGTLGWLARSFCLKHKIPFTSAFHTRFPEYMYARFHIPIHWGYAVLRKFHQSSSACLTPTSAIKQTLESKNFSHIKLWSRGVDTQVFKPNGIRLERSNSPVFLYAGRIAIEKQVDHFLGLDLPGEKWVAGDGPELPRLKSKYPSARWFGSLDSVSLATLYRSADALVFTSVTDTFGLVMLEAMACGTPVAAYPVAGPIDVVKPGVSGVLDQDLRRACLAASALPRDQVTLYAASFSWQSATQQFLSALMPIQWFK